MKKLVLISMVFGLMVTPALAVPTVATDHQIVNELIWDTFLGSWNSSAVWNHDNPFDGDYEEAVAQGDILGVTLTVNASCINTDDNKIATVFTDAYGVSHALPGFLQNGDNVFVLDPTWLDGVQVATTIDWSRSYCLDIIDAATINWSDLTVISDIVATVPAPGAVLLGGIGVCCVGWFRRKLL